MNRTHEQRSAAFRVMHLGGCFTHPGAWDVSSMRMLEHLGFETASLSGVDFGLALMGSGTMSPCAAAIEGLRGIIDSVDIPIEAHYNGAFISGRHGFAGDLHAMIDSGVAGLAIGDGDFENPDRTLGLTDAIERIRIARAVVDEARYDVVLTARIVGALDDVDAVHRTIDRMRALSDAGADCLQIPMPRDPICIAGVIRAIAPTPVAVEFVPLGPSLRWLADIGVRRVSIGASPPMVFRSRAPGGHRRTEVGLSLQMGAAALPEY